MQELMVYAGQLDCYVRSNEVIKQFLRVDVSAARVYRVTDTYGGEVGKTVNEEKALPALKQAEVLYAQADGSMILTRPWIRNWIADTFPQAISILDFYHAAQYLYGFAENYFDSQKQSHKWSEAQKKRLLKSQVGKVMDNIEKLSPDHPMAKKVLEYYRVNKERMEYKEYLKIGCGIIGSGTIESAHRTVVQKRLKLSGQRWTKKGAQNMLNLRVTRMNGQLEQSWSNSFKPNLKLLPDRDNLKCTRWNSLPAKIFYLCHSINFIGS